MKYKEGDKVRIVDVLYGHELDVGQVVKIISVCPEDSDYLVIDNYTEEDWWVSEREIEPVVEGDSVNHPSHYGQGNIEAIEYIEDFLTEEEYIGYLRGNIAKYMHRFRYKNGQEDLNKAKWYLERLIEVYRQ